MGNKSMLDWARWYIKKRLSVIPLKPKSKLPDGSVLPKGSWTPYTKRFATDKELVGWFGEGDRNIAILAGSLSDLVIVDLDSIKAIKFAMDMHFPKTPAVRTMKGLHLYYKYQEGVTNFQGRADLPDIDLRGEGGYVVAPPSIHPNGSIYKWQWPLSKYKVGELPQIILAQSSVDKKAFEEIWRRGLSKGERNMEMTRQIGKWITQGLNDEQIIILALEVAGRSDQPPGDRFTEQDITTILKSIRRKEDRSGVDRDTPEIEADPHKGMIKMADLAGMDLSIKWIVEKFIPEESITLFSAMGGTGKTRLMYRMASCITEGSSFLKEYECTKRKVYYVDFENPPALIDDMRKGMKLSGDINLWSIHQKNEEYRPKRISDKDWWEWYKQLEPGSILFIDTLRSSSIGFDENSSGDMGEYADRLKKLREGLGITVILEHHTRKGDKRIFRGSSAISDLVDNTLILYLKEFGKKNKDEDPDDEESEFGKPFYFGHGLPGEGKTRYIRERKQIVLTKDVGFIRYEDHLKEEGIITPTDIEIAEVHDKTDWDNI